MKRVVRLPAQDCRHFLRGRCVYEEVLNPGYHGSYRCPVLTRLQDLYDSFLNQAEAFGLDEAKAFGIWEKRFRELCQEDTGCQAHEPGDMNQFPGCVHCLADVCVLRLPECSGRCRNYTTKQRG